MKGKNHLTCGIIAGIGCAATGVIFKNINILNAGTMAVCAAAASLIPDIDIPNSKFGRLIKPISKLINKIFGHRTITHSILWIIPLIILYIKNIDNNYAYLVLGSIIGFLTHIFSDTFTRGGVPWLWPFKRKRYHITNVNSGEKDILFIILTDIILIGGYYLLVKNGVL